MAALEKNVMVTNTGSVPQPKSSSEAVKLVVNNLPIRQTASDSYVEVLRMTDKGSASTHDLEEAKNFVEIIRKAREGGLDLKYDLVAYALEEGRGSKFVTEVVQEKIADPGDFAGEIRFHGDSVVVSCKDGEVDFQDMPNLLEENRSSLIPLTNTLVKPEDLQPSKLAFVKLVAFDYRPKSIEQPVATTPQPEQPVTQVTENSEPVDYSKLINAPFILEKVSGN